MAKQLKGWTPIRLYWQGTCPRLDWCDLGGLRFAEPFFDQTVEKAMRRPFSLLFRHQTAIETAGELISLDSPLRPDGFIFHMSRCGSTLLAQMLAALPHTVVISEAGLVDQVLRANERDPSLSLERRAEWLRWVVGALGQRRAGGERRLFVKLDAWNVLDHAVVSRAFPCAPSVFLYREPVEVMVSQLKRGIGWMMSGALEPRLLGLGPTEAYRMPRDEYCARALGRVCEAAYEHRASLRLINYEQLPEVVFSSVLDLFGVARAAEDLGPVREATRFHSKTTSLFFEADTEEKRREAIPRVRELTKRFVRPAFERLEAARREQEAEVEAETVPRAGLFAREGRAGRG